jgi:hypothetical protein
MKFFIIIMFLSFPAYADYYSDNAAQREVEQDQQYKQQVEIDNQRTEMHRQQEEIEQQRAQYRQPDVQYVPYSNPNPSPNVMR